MHDSYFFVTVNLTVESCKRQYFKAFSSTSSHLQFGFLVITLLARSPAARFLVLDSFSLEYHRIDHHSPLLHSPKSMTIEPCCCPLEMIPRKVSFILNLLSNFTFTFKPAAMGPGLCSSCTACYRDMDPD